MDKETESMQADVSIWEYRVEQPSNFLQNLVCSYSGYREEVGRPICRLEIPKDRIILILGFGKFLHIDTVGSSAKTSKYRDFVVGLNANPLLVEHDGYQQGIEIELFPWAVNSLFGVSPRELAQGAVRLEDLWGNYAHLLAEQLSELSSWEDRFSLVDRVISEKVILSKQVFKKEIQYAWNRLQESKGCISTRQVAEEIGWSNRHFAVCFQEQIGIMPKAAARRIRFNYAHQLLQSPEWHNLSDIAAICGYSDQSHFTREFCTFAHYPPGVYRNAQLLDGPGTSGNIIKP